jgi:outer membrane protein assembly factor BamB
MNMRRDWLVWGLMLTIGGPWVQAADWPRWRGPAGNGIADESSWNAKALTQGVQPLWRAAVGAGYAAVSVQNGIAFTAGNTGDQDAVQALDAKTGKEMWRYAYPCKGGSYPGPRATPLIHDGRVYMLSREGAALCLDAAKGSLLWRQDIAKDTGTQNIGWGFSSSPVIEGDLVLLNAGESGTALDRRTGKIVWSSKGKGGYSTPVVYQSGEARCVALFSQKVLCAVRAADGKELWRFPWKTAYDVNAADPIVTGDRVFISSGYNTGCALLRVADNKPTPVWQNKAMRNHFSSCVLINGSLYGIDGNTGRGKLSCVDLETGAERWSRDTGFGALVAADGKLIVLNEAGALAVLSAKPEACEELSRAEKAVPAEKDEKCWTMPVLCGGLLYCRTSKGNLFCFDLSK